MTLKPQHLHPLALIQFSTRTIRDTFLYVVLAVIFFVKTNFSRPAGSSLCVH